MEPPGLENILGCLKPHPITTSTVASSYSVLPACYKSYFLAYWVSFLQQNMEKNQIKRPIKGITLKRTLDVPQIKHNSWSFWCRTWCLMLLFTCYEGATPVGCATTLEETGPERLFLSSFLWESFSTRIPQSWAGKTKTILLLDLKHTEHKTQSKNTKFSRLYCWKCVKCGYFQLNKVFVSNLLEMAGGVSCKQGLVIKAELFHSEMLWFQLSLIGSLKAFCPVNRTRLTRTHTRNTHTRTQ